MGGGGFSNYMILDKHQLVNHHLIEILRISPSWVTLYEYFRQGEQVACTAPARRTKEPGTRGVLEIQKAGQLEE